MKEEGVRFSQCVGAVAAYGEVLNALWEALDEMLPKELHKAKAELPCKLVGRVVHAERMDDSGWVYTDFSSSYPLVGKMGRTKSTPDMYLSYQISLWGDGMSFSDNEEPLLHVCLWHDKFSFGDDYFYMGYPLDDEPFHLDHNRLIMWGDGKRQSMADWKNNLWTFSLKLLSLEKKDDLMSSIIEPSMSLLRGVPTPEALPEDMPGLVMFDNPDVLKSLNVP